MPFVEHTNLVDFSAPVAEPAPVEQGSLLGAAFRQENDVLAAIELLTPRNRWPRDPEFKIVSALQEYDTANRTGFWSNYRDNFLGVESQEEMLSIIGKINQERRDQEQLSGAGFTGLVAQIGAGILSPTTFLPFIGQTKGFVAGARKGAALGALGGALQEFPLQAAQETRSAVDSALSIGGAAIVGGMLGGAMGAISKSQFEVLARQLEIEAGMAQPTVGRTISPLSAGIAEAREMAGRLKHSAAMKVADWTSPVTRVINQEDSRIFSWGMSQVADAGLYLEGNARGVNTAVGGTVENNVKVYLGMVGKVAQNVDDLYAKYIFEGRPPPGFGANTRAMIEGAMSSTKMSRPEFRMEVSRALRNNDEHVIPEVAAAAKFTRENLFNPIFERAKAAGLISETAEIGDPSYLHRMYDIQKIAANPQKFIAILAKNFAERENAEFGERLAKHEKWAEKQRTRAEDLVRTKEEVEALRAQFKTAEDKLLDARSEDLKDNMTLIRLMQNDISRLQRKKEPGFEEKIKVIKGDIQRLRGMSSEELKEFRARQREIRWRTRGLNKGEVALGEKLDKKLEQIEELEDLNIQSLEAVARAGQRLLNKLSDLSDKKLNKELSKLKDQFAAAADQFDAVEDRIIKLREDQGPMDPLFAAGDKSDKLAYRMGELGAKLDLAEEFDRVKARTQIEDILRGVLQEKAATIAKRDARIARLWELAEKADPAIARNRAKELGERVKQARAEFIGRVRDRGASDIDLDARSADFLPRATEIATNVKDRILGTYLRMPSVDIMLDKRGPELRRVLNIESSKIEDFLENDIDRVARTYARTMAGDIEMMRRFNTVNGESVIDEAADEMNDKLVKLGEKAEKEQWSEEKLAKANKAVRDNYEKLKHDFEVVVGRIRNTWGLPKDPNAMSWRIGKTLLDMNVLRLMGGTLISSIPDISRVMMRHGFGRAFADGYAPMVSDWKRLSIAKREARYAGVALDSLMHMRAQGVHDVLDDLGRHSKFERGMNFLSNKMGMINLLDQWTDMMKQVSASAAIARISDSIDIVYGGAKVSAKEKDAAISFLASKGLMGKLGEDIHLQLHSPEGGTRVNGILMPNTEAWTSIDAQQAFRSALAGEVDASIITPGVERAVWMDASMTGRLISQFKSFAMSSTQKILMAGLQNPTDMGVIAGSAMSIAMGMLSYYIASVVSGGDTYSKMQNAPLGKWIDEGIARSGILGIFADGQRFAERIPIIQPYANFGGDRVSRRSGDDMAELLLGPSFSGFVGASKFFQGLDDPTQNTLQELRRLAPFQNHFAIKRPLDLLIQSTDLPERR